MQIDLTDRDFVNGLVANYYGWQYCFNEGCPRASECIRFISSKFKPVDVTNGAAVYPDACLHGPCQHFMRVRQYKAAWGLSQLYDNVKHRDAKTIKYQVMGAMGSRTSYYRVHRGEKRLTPEEQEAVSKIFAHFGYQAPSYDHYSTEIGFVYE